MDSSDQEELYRLATNPQVMRFIGRGTVWEQDEVQDLHAWNLAHWRQYDFGARVLIEKETGRWIGFVDLMYARPEEWSLKREMSKSAGGSALLPGVAGSLRKGPVLSETMGSNGSAWIGSSGATRSRIVRRGADRLGHSTTAMTTDTYETYQRVHVASMRGHGAISVRTGRRGGPVPTRDVSNSSAGGRGDGATGKP